MLRQFGTCLCPRCDTDLVQRDAAGATASIEGERWVCPSCDYSRPVVYEVEREGIRRHNGWGRLSCLRRERPAAYS